MIDIQNPFTAESLAGRYDRGRPYFHPLVIERIRRRMPAGMNIHQALDVGCGTGLSTRALLALAERVEGLDASPAMLKRAHRDPRITYQLGRAEELGYPEESIDLLTVSQTLHWTDQGRFFERAAGVLKPGGWLVIYDNFFLWRAGETTPFSRWYRERYLKTFPPPPRGQLRVDAAGSLRPRGFDFAGYEEYSTPESLTRGRLIDYLVTQSNMAAAIDARSVDLGAAVSWLERELPPFFGSRSTLTFPFGGPIYCLVRAGGGETPRTNGPSSERGE